MVYRCAFGDVLFLGTSRHAGSKKVLLSHRSTSILVTLPGRTIFVGAGSGLACAMKFLTKDRKIASYNGNPIDILLTSLAPSAVVGLAMSPFLVKFAEQGVKVTLHMPPEMRSHSFLGQCLLFPPSKVRKRATEGRNFFDAIKSNEIACVTVRSHGPKPVQLNGLDMVSSCELGGLDALVSLAFRIGEAFFAPSGWFIQGKDSESACDVLLKDAKQLVIGCPFESEINPESYPYYDGHNTIERIITACKTANNQPDIFLCNRLGGEAELAAFEELRTVYRNTFENSVPMICFACDASEN